MSAHEPKVAITPRTPLEMLDAVTPMGTTAYGSTVRTKQDRRLYRSDRVTIDWQGEVGQHATLWELQETGRGYATNSDYSEGASKVERSLGHFHGNRQGKLTGFCPNEQLPFQDIDRLMRLLTA